MSAPVDQAAEPVEIDRLRQEVDELRRRLRASQEEIAFRNEAFRRQRLASLNLMEDAVMARDRSEQANKAFRESEARVRALFEAAPDAIIVLNEKREIVLVNVQAERMFGRDRESLLGESVNLLIPERFRKGGPAELTPLFSNQDPRVSGQPAAEAYGLRIDGEEFPVEVNLSPLETHEGLFIFCSVRDVTERKNTEQRARQLELMAAEAQAASKAKSMFLSTMSHKIRTPMNAILGYSQLMMRDSTLSADAQEYLKIINRSGEHLLHMINDVLDMARIEAGRMQLNPTAFDLFSLVRDLEAMFRVRAEAKSIQLELCAGGQLNGFIRADEGKIRQVLINLLGNAISFTEQGKVGLNVNLERRGDGKLWFSAEVSDTGVGMTEQEQLSVFQPFVQGQANQRLGHGGTGLGLAISRGVAQLMGGEIRLRSALSEGSTFHFEVPVEHAEGKCEARAAIEHRRVVRIRDRQVGPRILIADDVLDNREWLRMLLTSVGFSVRWADNGDAAVRIWEEWSPDLVLMDIHMPLMDGLEATKAIRSRQGDRPVVVIALTADALNEHRNLLLQNGFDDFIAKPCPEEELLEKVRIYLRLTYVYEDEFAPAAAPTGLTRMEEKRIAALPSDSLEALRKATLNGDKALMDRLIAQIGKEFDEQAGQTLHKLADLYQYERILELLEEA